MLGGTGVTKGSRISILQNGGCVDGAGYDDPDDPLLRTGARYVMFVSTIPNGEGVSHRPVGQARARFAVGPDGTLIPSRLTDGRSQAHELDESEKLLMGKSQAEAAAELVPFLRVPDRLTGP